MEESLSQTAMVRIAFVMQVDPAKHDEYRARHAPIWPELEAVLRAHGVVGYSIFLDPPTSQLFAFAEVEDRAQWDAIAQTDVCQRWWRSMSAMMPSNADFSPVSRELQEVFRIER